MKLVGRPRWGGASPRTGPRFDRTPGYRPEQVLARGYEIITDGGPGRRSAPGEVIAARTAAAWVPGETGAGADPDARHGAMPS